MWQGEACIVKSFLGILFYFYFFVGWSFIQTVFLFGVIPFLKDHGDFSRIALVLNSREPPLITQIEKYRSGTYFVY